MGNLKHWIETEAAGEPIEAVIIGAFGWSGYQEPDELKAVPQGKLMTWTKAAPLLDYDFSSGYGAPRCHAIMVWSATKVITVGQYDGSTWPYSLPRYPTETVPEMHGG